MHLPIVGPGFVMQVAGCAKEPTVTKKAERTLSQNDVKIGNTIQAFKSKVVYYNQHPDLKSSETIAADSVLWLPEATINYSHAFPNEFYANFSIDSLEVRLLNYNI